MRQRELEIRLEAVPAHPRPLPNLEQYRTPPKIAADLLYRAAARGDIMDRRVVDFGCGTGMFAIGAALLGAESAVGIDVDATAIEAAIAAAKSLGVEVGFTVGDVRESESRADTVVMNPPFGAQFGARHLDTAFLEAAVRAAPVIYSLHATETARFLERWAGRAGRDAELLARYEFPLPAQFEFHTKAVHHVPVSLYRFEGPVYEG